MSDPARSSYAQLLRAPGAASAFAAATLARLSYATISLALLLLVQSATGSFAAAGAALGAFGVPVLAKPFIARLVDRYGRKRVLIPSGLAYGLVLMVIALCGASGVSASGAYVALSVVAGLLSPPVGPVMRQIWSDVTSSSADRQRAYSLDTVSEEVMFAVGPLVVAGLVTASGPVAAMAFTAAVGLVGSVALATRPTPPLADPAVVDQPRRWGGPLAFAGFRRVAVATLVVGAAMTLLEVAATGRATESGAPATAGVLLTVMSVASAAGGLVWGRLRHRRSLAVQLAGLLGILAAGSIAAGLLPSLLAIGGVLAFAGLATSPVFVVTYLLADELVPASAHVEASTWLTTAHNLGGAAGAAAAGVLIERYTAPAAFIVGGVIFAGTAAALSVARRQMTPGVPRGARSR